MVFYVNTNDVEFGIKLNEKEVEEFGAGMALMMNDGSLTELIKKFTSAFEKEADEHEEETSEEPEEATDDEKLRDEYISKLRSLGFKVTTEDEEPDRDPVRIHCRTYGNLDDIKMKIVKDYLHRNEVEIIKGISPTGRDEIDYYLWPHQVKELTDLISQDEDTYSDGKIII